jgi:signal recognition particle receptor subunit beta
MAWYDQDSWLTAAFAPRASTMLATFLLMILVPILLHYFLYRAAAAPAVPTFIVLGPSGAGKTSLVTHVRAHSLQNSIPHRAQRN